MPDIRLTQREARRFLLKKQGLLGDYRFQGKTGVLTFIRQAGCIQFDPVDVCGKNAEIVLQSRVQGFTRSMLEELLYTDRKLLDYFDKNLSVIPVENWKYFSRQREKHRKEKRSWEQIQQVRDRVLSVIAEKGPLCSADLDFSQKVDWYWNETRLSRAVLEHLYFAGELVIHHKKGNVKYYDLAENIIPAPILQEPDPYPCDFDHRKWRVLQRIGSVGLLWNRASDAWLGIDGLTAKERNAVFSSLLSESRILCVRVEGSDFPFYCRREDEELLHACRVPGREACSDPPRCEYIAPLDNMMWDRDLIKELFGFAYKWEIYTPKSQRQYGSYVLPILYGERFVGRIEMVFDKKNRELRVLHLWYEPDVQPDKDMEEAIRAATGRFEKWRKGESD